MMQSTRHASVLAAAVLLLSAATESAAQVRPGMGGRTGSEPSAVARVYGLGGWAPIDVDALNARLAGLREPYTPVTGDMVLAGAGMHVRFRRVLLGGEGALLYSTEDAEFEDERRARFSGAYGVVTLGFSILGTDGLDIYPLLQIGGAGLSLEVEERGAPTWDELLEEPGRSTLLSTGSIIGAAGLGLDYAFRNGILLGLRGTWNYTPHMDDWNADGDDVLGGPTIDMRGPSLRLLLGFGGRGRS